MSVADTLLVVDCMADPLMDACPCLATHWLRPRADTVLQALQGNRDYIEGFNEAAARIEKEYNLSVAKIPSFQTSQINVFMLSTLMDAVQVTYDVDGYPLSPATQATAKWEPFLSKYERNDPLSVDTVVSIYCETDTLLGDATRGVLVYPPYRLAEEHLEHNKRMKDITVGVLHTLIPKGWKLFPVPKDAPPDRDGYWIHYDRAWRKSFMEQCLKQLGVKGCKIPE